MSTKGTITFFMSQERMVVVEAILRQSGAYAYLREYNTQRQPPEHLREYNTQRQPPEPDERVEIRPGTYFPSALKGNRGALSEKLGVPVTIVGGEGGES